MPNCKTIFREEWLQNKDSNGHLLEYWCQKQSKYGVHCRFCNKTIRCDNRGLSQLIAHSETKILATLVKDIADGKQRIFLPEAITSTLSADVAKTSSQPTKLTCLTPKNKAVKAEILWCLKVASSNLPYNCVDDLNELFCTMFPDSNIASQFSMRPAKLSYMITEAIGPYFHDSLLYDVKRSNSPYTLCFDELTNKEVKKQIDIQIRYWSNESNMVKIHHLNTYLMSRGKGKDIADKIFSSIDDNKLPLKNLLTLGSDGPNVNKTIFSLISEAKKSQELPALLNVGTCNLHIVQGAFGKVLKEFGGDVVDLVLDLHNFFKLSPVRLEEFSNIQDKHGLQNLKFLKHVDCRWLSLGLALERIKSQWSAICDYFLKELPKRDTKISENARYQRIIKLVKAPNSTLLTISFLISICNSLQPFMAFFQRQEPLIHLLHEYMTQITKGMFSRFLKVEVIKKKTIEELSKLKFPSVEHELKDDDLEIGTETRNFLNELRSDSKKIQLVSMRIFIRTLVQNLVHKLPFGNPILKEAACLKPENRCQPWTIHAIKNLASHVQLEPPLNIDKITAEWKIFQCDNIPKEWFYIEVGENIEHQKIDNYFSKIFALKDALGNDKYPELVKLVKSVLVIPHGNADVERGFSQTSKFLTQTRTKLSEASISALQTTKDGLKRYDNCSFKVPITPDLINKGMMAHKSYLARLEEEKIKEAELKKKKEEERAIENKKKEELERQKEEFDKKSRQTKETILKEKSLEKKDETTLNINVYKTLVDEANERIKMALKRHDFKEIQIGQTMLEAAVKKVDESANVLKEIRSEQKEIEKSKRTMLDYFCSSQSKKFKKL